jgi:hypothetical protein
MECWYRQPQNEFFVEVYIIHSFRGRVVPEAFLKGINMKQKLSFTSRILVAFASGALIAVFFLPAWRIDLLRHNIPKALL